MLHLKSAPWRSVAQAPRVSLSLVVATDGSSEILAM
jgi:hypothetical protein